MLAAEQHVGLPPRNRVRRFLRSFRVGGAARRQAPSLLDDPHLHVVNRSRGPWRPFPLIASSSSFAATVAPSVRIMPVMAVARGELVRVFPTRGKRQPWPKPRQGGGGPLLYSNYRTQIWKPFLERLGIAGEHMIMSGTAPHRFSWL